MQKHGKMGFFQARRIRRRLKTQSGMLSRSASSSVAAARAISSHSAAGTRNWLTLSYCPSISRGPRCAARRLHRLRRPPAHVGPQPRLLSVRSSVLAVGHVHPGRRSTNGRVFSSPVAGFSMTHIKGSKCAMTLSTTALPKSRRG